MAGYIIEENLHWMNHRYQEAKTAWKENMLQPQGQFMLECGYDLMHRVWRKKNVPETLLKVATEEVAQLLQKESSTELQDYLNEFPGRFIAFHYPVREYHNLISSFENFRLENGKPTYYNYAFPVVTDKAIFTQAIRKISIGLSGKSKDFGTLPLKVLWHIQVAQEALDYYERTLDQVMISELGSRQLPDSILEFDNMFGPVSKMAIDHKGGIERFMDTREPLYVVFDKLANTHFDRGNLDMLVSHFRKVCHEKIALYKDVSDTEQVTELLVVE